MSSDPTARPTSQGEQSEPAQATPVSPANLPEAQNEATDSPAENAERRKLLIGSQRDAAAYRPKPKRDWVPQTKREESAPVTQSPPAAAEASLPPVQREPEDVTPAQVAPPTAPERGDIGGPASPPDDLAPAPSQARTPEPVAAAPQTPPAREEERPRRNDRRQRERDREAERIARRKEDLAAIAVPKKFPPPNIRDRLSPDLEAELREALGEAGSVEEMMLAGESVTNQQRIEPETKLKAKVVAVHADNVFVDLGGREQGMIPLRLFTENPEPGAELEVVVVRFNPEDGLYELMLPGSTASVGDWSSIYEGMQVEARVTGHNSGGLECEINRLRGFIPISQISLYRVENLEEFLEQKFVCLVTECNPMRQNLVLSRRAVLEREKEEAKREMLQSLAPGQIYEGVVRKLMDFGAFVDLGSGVDGLIHISQLGWGRVKHPSDVLQEGQRVSVRVDKINPENGKISLGYRELVEESPWARAENDYLPGTAHRGRVVKIMDFGAFVELEPGLEGLVHISELSHKRVARVADVVKDGDEVDVAVLSVDPAARRISLSMKTLLAPPEPAAKPEAAAEQAAEAPAEPPKPKNPQPNRPLQGGLGKSSGGAQFGLKW